MYPENTMASFKDAVQVGAHAIETDVHLTADGVVVLSHVRTVFWSLFPTCNQLTVCSI